MSEIYEYYDEEWRTKIFDCNKCDWSGTHEEMSGSHTFNELFVCRCANCFKMLLKVDYPTDKKTWEAAALGNKLAIKELGILSGEGKYFEEFKREIEESKQALRDMWERYDGTIYLYG